MAVPFTVRLTPDGYVVSCEGPAGIEGHGPTESAAWTDFWKAMHTEWQPPADPAEPGVPGGSAPSDRGRDGPVLHRRRG
ncbi:hypothetical protein [Streptomyces sp. NPDC089919]|uniref:hypothetical protein n=1 Tax=Streptomyces sp. NPDC089919 TaxID=3155188 RepID=UPI003449479A